MHKRRIKPDFNHPVKWDISVLRHVSHTTARKAEKDLCWSTNTMKSGSLSKGAPHWPEMQVWGFWWWDSLWLIDGADTHSEWAGGWWSLPPGGCWLPWQNWWCRRIRRSEAAPLDCAQSTGDKTMHFVHDMTFHWSGFEVWMLNDANKLVKLKVEL